MVIMLNGANIIYCLELTVIYATMAMKIGAAKAAIDTIIRPEQVIVCLFCCFTSQVNSYVHCGTVSSPNHTFFLGKLEQAVNQ